MVAVAQEEQRHLGAGEELLDEHRARPAGTHRRARARPSRSSVTMHALARGQPVGLHDVRAPELVERGLDLGAGGGAQRAPGRHARGIHDPLGERLRALELRGRLAGPEHRDAALAQRVGDARDERCLRADDDEVDRVLVREAGHGGRVVLIEVDDRRVAGRSRRCRGPRRSRARHPPTAARG